ncbi:ferrous iron transport protein B [Bacteriovorax sp. BSW11_IV]|uniref:ferrous iron transport protein B n=1 Tax=Bacteriovorax sp. BSW11_IV TaxID=1353529 RepID=UPI00038A2E89|nr:ferrous iron transport protein B [Bacteriovorax sp. BSW11_IV]EQC49922.1 ferrous iron transport protein B [Bacteriovorax sp. BSW11_IV]
MKTILILGCPNSGKTALFNNLSGSNRKVANYSGITVDTASAALKSNKDNKEQIRIVDIPGIYSLVPSSIDEAVTISTIIGENPTLKTYDDILVVVDITRLDASLSLVLALKDYYGDVLKVVFNKTDLETAKNIDLDGLGKNLGLPYIITSSQKNDSARVDKFIRENLATEKIDLKQKIKLSEISMSFNPFNVDFSKHELVECDHNEVDTLAIIESYQRKGRDLKLNYTKDGHDNYIRKTNKIDSIVLHPFFGGLIFLAVFYIIFHSLYTFSTPLMDLIDNGVASFGEWAGAVIPEGLLNSFIVDGIIAGVGGVIIFLPQIMILFFLLSLLEQSGYISRASILTDKIMSYFGLNGKAFLPYMSGFACAVPAIMATRTIADKKERLATLMTIPLITCSARLPVYILLIGTFVPNETVLGIFNLQALSFFFLYFLGSFVALIMAKIFRLTFYKGKTNSFIIELPLYLKPSLRVAAKSSILKGKVFLKKAGTIILALSVVIWVLSTFPKPNEDKLVGMTEAQQASYSLENSVMGKLGKSIEPIIRPIGYDWKMGVGILVAFGARELFVSTLGTIYALGDVDEESATLRERLRKEVDPITGKPVFNLAVAWSLLIFFAFAAQCISTLGIVRRETDSWKSVFGMMGYMTLLAYGGAFVVYQLLI